MQRGYTQGIEVFAFAPSKLLVNRRSNEVVNIASTKMMKKLFPSLRGAEGDEAIQSFFVTLDCFVAALLAMTVRFTPGW
jgi:hypothetical protein